MGIDITLNPHFETVIPISKWGSTESPLRNGVTHSEMGIDVTSNPRFEMGIPVSKRGCYYPPFEMGIPIPKQELMKRTIPVSEQGSPF